MSRVEYRSHDADIDIGRLFGALWRDKLRILFGGIIFTAIVYLGLSFVTPIYESDARILIESSESVFTRPDREQSQAPDATRLDQQGVTSQVEILTSSDLLLQVARELNLGQSDEFDGTMTMSGLKAGLVALGLVEDPSLIPAEKRILDNIRDRLDVYAVENSRVMVIEFRSRDKELATRFPNTLASEYLKLERREQLDNTGKAASYLADEIAELQQSLRRAEAAVAGFRGSSDLLVGQNDESLATQQLAELASELSRVRANRSSADARARSVRAALQRGASIDSLPDVVQSPLIGRLREREIALNTEIAELATTLLPGHPRIQGLRSQLSDLSRLIRDEAGKVLIGLENEAEISRGREAELTADLNELKAASVNASEREVELRALEREADSQRALLESYLVRYREAQSRDEGGYAPAKARLISRAIPASEPVFPKMIPFLGAAFFVSLLLMMLATIIRELQSGRAFVLASAPPATAPAVSGLETTSVAATAASAPKAEKPKTPVHETQEPADPATADNYGIDALARLLVDRGIDRAIVVSPEGDAGAAATVELARKLSTEGLRTVLVDLTSTGAASRRMLEDQDCPGITDLLAASSSYSDVIYPDFATDAHIIPTGTADPVRAMRAVERLPIILEALASAYDIVIVECGPTNAGGLKRLAGEGSQIVLTVVDPAAPEIIETAGNLVDGGFDDLMLVTADGLENGPVGPAPRRAYAR